MATRGFRSVPKRIELMSNNILRRPAVEAKTGLSRSTIYEMMSRGEFPKPIQLGKRAVGWPESALDAWLESRKAA